MSKKVDPAVAEKVCNDILFWSEIEEQKDLLLELTLIYYTHDLTDCIDTEHKRKVADFVRGMWEIFGEIDKHSK